ncbi:MULTISPECIES: hypothetical protein [Bacillaceae]|uniref:Uncharacterized protein n=1 Tax=Gottfriedia luciferensis TaxID=178774 RepID=A0ABX2ZUK2_9BACI|nr:MULTISPECIES: hypothetical protein [Bacillaceae]ODG93426.1 hypothetical protein BED47_03835 [Gottfriedia luciferensis]PGZ93336.1 hypothetical protein COE53_06455 [Bacillus sp. AFS029533]
MSLFKKYGKWISKKNPRRHDLAELLLGIIFVPAIIAGIELIYHRYSSFWFMLFCFLFINLYLLSDNLITRIMGRFNVKISKWMHPVIPWILVCVYFVLNGF